MCVLGCTRADTRGAAVDARAATPVAARTIALVNGNWLIGDRVVTRTRYIANGAIADQAPTRPDTTIDLANGFVIPPFGEAHNHNVEASSRVDALIARYLRDGVFYVENPNVLPRSRAALAGKVNTPTGVDVAFANGGLTGSGGHPLELVRRNVARGIWTEADGEGAFYWTIDNRNDLERKWPAIVAQRPDFIKVYLLYSEQYKQRANDSAVVGWRGLDPSLVPEIVRRAHAASLRVAAHIETVADFRVALAAGVDQVAHMPGFRGDEHVQLPDPIIYTLTADDAREAARRGVTIVTTLGGAGEIDSGGPDSLARRALDALNRRNLTTLRRAGVTLALGSDTYRDDSKGEAGYLHGLGVFDDAELVRLWAYDTPRAIFPKRAIGGLTAGSEASFLVLGCNPFARFACTDSIRLRVKDGRVLTVPDAPTSPR
jgi:imidazolonepropionase-like amidohydrolase